MSEFVMETQKFVPFRVADPTSSADALRTQMDEYGYLFFRKLIPAEPVRQVRQQVLEILDSAGWLDRTRPLMDGIAAPELEPKTEGMPDYTDAYRQVLRLPAFHEFPNHPALLAIAAQLLNGEAFVHPRRIGRITFPGSVRYTTPAHQDFFYIRGAVETFSCWTPLGDCPTTLGGLAVWPGSHKQGFIEHTVSHPGAVGGCGVPVDESRAIWHTDDFGIGDALFFRSYTIHKALPNLTSDHLRLSTDNRYQMRNAAIDPPALLPHV